jgi:hypothetical protein
MYIIREWGRGGEEKEKILSYGGTLFIHPKYFRSFNLKFN